MPIGRSVFQWRLLARNPMAIDEALLQTFKLAPHMPDNSQSLIHVMGGRTEVRA